MAKTSSPFQNYDASLESEEDDRRRGEWRKEMKLNRQRGTSE